MSQIFYPYKSAGIYSEKLPFSIFRYGDQHAITVPLHHSFQTFNCETLRLSTVGPQFKKRVRALAPDNLKVTYVAAGRDLFFCRRNRVLKMIGSHDGNINFVLKIGGCIATVGDDKVLKIWDIKDNKQGAKRSIKLRDNCTPSYIIHPNTYINKILIGSKEGPLYLYNFDTTELLYTFEGWKSPVKCIAQSPAVDTVAIGLRDGRIILHNLKYDRTLFVFSHDQDQGEVTSLTFRTDAKHILVSGTKNGTIATWDLEKKKLITVAAYAHTGPVVSMHMLWSEPILVSSSSDNSIKVWIFDQINLEPRLLRKREGHFGNPISLKFLNTQAMLATGAEDGRFRIIFPGSEQKSREISQKNHQANFRVYLPPVLGIAYNPVKQSQWDSILTYHLNHRYAYTWDRKRFAAGKHKFRFKSIHSFISAVAISKCGNFGIIGAQSGDIAIFNMQSGLEQGEFKHHQGPITGLYVDLLNFFIISTSLDGTIAICLRETLENLSIINVGSPISKTSFIQEAGLIAVACENNIIYVYDIVTQKLVRKFQGHVASLTNILISNDARWIVSTDVQCEVRVWDIPASKCIDWFKVKSPITSFTFSPSNAFLATSHVGYNGVYIWANGTFFGDVFMKAIPSKPAVIQNPVAVPSSHDENEFKELIDAEEGKSESEEEEEEENNETGENMEAESSLWSKVNAPEQLNKSLITLSTQPKSKWQTLVFLENIKERNTIVTPKKSIKTPFFLPSIPGLEPEFLKPTEADNTISTKINESGLRPKTKFISLLEQDYKDNEYSNFLDYFLSMSPTNIDHELKSLDSIHGQDEHKMVLHFYLNELPKRKNFEFLQATLQVFLKANVDIISEDEELQKLSKLVLNINASLWSNVQELIQSNLCLLNHFSNTLG